MEPGQADFDLEGYLEYWNSAEKKGYSGTAVFTKQQPLTVRYGMGIAEHDHEGRLITLEYPSFFLVCCFTPNAQRGLTRLDYRMQWEDDLRRYLLCLDQEKPVVYCGDLNVAHREIDLKNAKSNQGNAGFTQQERAKLSQLLACGFVDSFRHFYPDWQAPIAGGPTSSMPGPITPAGALTTSSPPSASSPGPPPPAS